MGTFRIEFSETKASDSGRRLAFINFQSEHDTIEALTAALNDGIVCGRQLHARRADTPERAFVVTSRSPFSLSKQAISTIKPLPVPIFDEQGNPLHEDTKRRQVENSAGARGHHASRSGLHAR